MPKKKEITSVLNKGDKVDIFYNPLTRSRIEGTARLVRFLGIDGYYRSKPLELWVIKFLGEGNKNEERTLLAIKSAKKKDKKA